MECLLSMHIVIPVLKCKKPCMCCLGESPYCLHCYPSAWLLPSPWALLIGYRLLSHLFPLRSLPSSTIQDYEFSILVFFCSGGVLFWVLEKSLT